MVQDGNQMQPDTPAYGRPEAQTQPTAPEEPARLGPVQRFFGVLFSPTETFEDVNRKPNWIVPILIIMVTVLASTLFFNWKVHPNWDAIIRKQITESIEKRGAQMPSEDQIQRQVDFGKTIAKFSPAIAAVAAPILYLVLAGIFALGLMFIQAQPTYAKVLSVTAWSGAATSVVSTLVFCAALMVQDQQTLDSIDPTKGVNFVPTNLGAFLSSGASTVIRVIASSIDIFTIWFLILLSIGFAATSGARKITTSKTASLVFGLWIVWIVLRIGWNMLF